MNTMKRIGIISAFLTMLVGADGLYMMAAHYKADDVNSFNLSDGGSLLLAAGILLVVTVIAFLNSKGLDKSNKEGA